MKSNSLFYGVRTPRYIDSPLLIFGPFLLGVLYNTPGRKALFQCVPWLLVSKSKKHNYLNILTKL